MNATRQTHIKGQILVLFAVGLVVMIAVAALLVDGGQIYMNRRAAQASADAAALAGAQELCMGARTEAAAEARAINYALTQNEGSTATADANFSTRQVAVNVEINQPTFFAGIFGFGNLNIPANATAACLPPAGNYILPIAWACPDLITDPVTGQVTGCNYATLDWDTELSPLINGQAVTIDDGNPATSDVYGPNFRFDRDLVRAKPYIIMDSLKVTVDTYDLCLFDELGNPNPDGYLDCTQISSSGSRSWLDLDGGGGGASELVDWIECDNPATDRCDDPFQVVAHTWVNDQSGNISSLYNTLVNYDNLPTSNPRAVRFLPVYNAVCTDEPNLLLGDSDPCINMAHPPNGVDDTNVGNGNTYFHLMGIAEFYITCVDRSGGGFDCPLHQALNVDRNGASVEGYFVKDFPIPKTTVGQGNIDMGIYTISLIE